MDIKNKIELLREIAHSDANAVKKRLWSDCLALKKTRPLVNVYFYQYVWQRQLCAKNQNCGSPLADYIDKQVSYKLWRWQNIKDDTPVEFFLRIPCDILSESENTGPLRNNLWGIEIELEKNTVDGSYRVVPPVKSDSDIDKIKLPVFEPAVRIDELVEQVNSLTGGGIPVKIDTEKMHWGPFEYVVWLRGMDNLFLDFIDNPSIVHRLMSLAAEGIIGWQKRKEAAGFVDSELSFFGHVPYDEYCAANPANSLKSCWAYLHAQSSGSISPQMYNEFVQPYNEKIASLVGRVYYHGCENLDAKSAFIRRLPNLRLFHISPWSNVEPVLANMGDAFVYEVHSHPAKVLNEFDDTAMRDELETRTHQAEGVNHILTLADLETVAGCFDRVQKWVDSAVRIALA